ncbi:MAG: PorT family protein [Treponema sp.]|nr:PorT family protein [Treponema sp.]
MKKLLVLLVGLVLSANAFAIELSAGPKLDLGLFGGIIRQHYDNVTVKPATTAKFTGRIGGVFGIKINDMFSIEPELMIHFGNGLTYVGYKKDVKMSGTTLELPVMAKLKFDLGPGKLVAAVGPQIDIILGKVKYGDEKVDLDDYGMDRLGLSVAAGVEYELPLGPGSLVPGLRYQVNLTNWANSDADDIMKIRFYSIMPSVAYMFKF